VGSIKHEHWKVGAGHNGASCDKLQMPFRRRKLGRTQSHQVEGGKVFLKLQGCRFHCSHPSKGRNVKEQPYKCTEDSARDVN